MSAWPIFRRAVIYILLVEDNPADVEIIRNSFREANLTATTGVVRDGDEAIELLANCRSSMSLRPDLIVLDLGLPSADGFEVLDALSSDELLRSIPVVVLTQSDAAHDKNRVERFSVARFVTKPKSLDGYVDVARELSEVASLSPSAEL